MRREIYLFKVYRQYYNRQNPIASEEYARTSLGDFRERHRRSPKSSNDVLKSFGRYRDLAIFTDDYRPLVEVIYINIQTLCVNLYISTFQGGD